MTKRMRNARVTVLVLCVAATTATLSAQQVANAPARAQAQQIDRYVVGQAKPPETPGTRGMELTLEQAIQAALDKNLDVQAAKLNPQIQDYQLQSARAFFRPTIGGTSSVAGASSVTTSKLDAVGTNRVTGTQTYNTSVTQRAPWYGGNGSVAFNNSRGTDNSANTTINPTFQSSVRLSYTQPLLANFKIDTSRNQLKTLQVQRQITDIALLTTIENTKASVRTAYWALRSAIEAIEINKRSFDLAKRQYEDNKIKVEIGTMAQIDVTTSETTMVNAEQAIVNAQITWRTAELALKRLLVGGADDDIYKATINPVDVPTFGAEPVVDIPGAVQTALAQRTDIVTARKNLEVSSLNLDVTRNATLPQLDLSTNYTLNGTGGPKLTNGLVTTPGGYVDALKGITSLNTPSWNVGFTFSYPLGMASAKASFARAELQLEQSRVTLKAQELTITADVTNAGLAVQNAYAQVQVARKAREVAERNADAEQTKFDVGLSNNYNVATAQNNLTQQRLNELSAIIRYINAVADFDKKLKVGG
jgi:outer membrane protein TolC